MILSRVVATGLLFAFAVQLPAFVVPAAVPASQGSGPLVALTFDDGPWPVPTARLVHLLRRHGAKATFFVVGHVAERHPETVRLLAREGHELANHTWSHPDLRDTSPAALRFELARTRLLIKRLTGADTPLFRTPGSTRHFLRRRFRSPIGYDLVLWDVHSMDHALKEPDAIADRILSSVQAGDIILLHNGTSATLEALDHVLATLRRKGFEFVTVSELRRRSVLYGGAFSESSIVSTPDIEA